MSMTKADVRLRQQAAHVELDRLHRIIADYPCGVPHVPDDAQRREVGDRLRTVRGVIARCTRLLRDDDD